MRAGHTGLQQSQCGAWGTCRNKKRKINIRGHSKTNKQTGTENVAKEAVSEENQIREIREKN